MHKSIRRVEIAGINFENAQLLHPTTSTERQHFPLLAPSGHPKNCDLIILVWLNWTIQAPPSYGFGRYGFGVFRTQDSIPRDRCSAGTRHAFFSITFVSIYAVSWGRQSSVTRSGFPGPKNPKSSATKTTTWHCSNHFISKAIIATITFTNKTLAHG